MLVEIRTFTLVADEAAFLEADRSRYAELAASAPGFLRRTTARGDDGRWLVLTLWHDSAPSDEEFAGLVDDVRVERYHTLD